MAQKVRLRDIQVDSDRSIASKESSRHQQDR
jgi:hypothetical protein